MPSDPRLLCRAGFHPGPSHQGSSPQPPSPSLLPPGCEVVPDVNVSGQKFCIKLLVPSPEGMREIYLRCQDVRQGPGPGPLEAGAKWALGGARPGARGGARPGARGGARPGPSPLSPPLPPQEQQYARWMAGCRLASKGRTMADSSYSSEVQAILAFLSLQRTGGGGGGSGNHPQGPDASAEGLNPYGLVAPRFQRKFKAKQVPGRVGGGTDQRVYVANLGPWISTEPSPGNARAHSLILPPGSWDWV